MWSRADLHDFTVLVRCLSAKFLWGSWSGNLRVLFRRKSTRDHGGKNNPWVRLFLLGGWHLGGYLQVPILMESCKKWDGSSEGIRSPQEIALHLSAAATAPPQTNSSPLKIGHPQGKFHLSTIHFQVQTVSFRAGGESSHLVSVLITMVIVVVP